MNLTRREFGLRAAGAASLGPLVFMESACPSGQTVLTTTLQGVVTAVSIILPIVAPAIAPFVTPYLNQVTTAVDEAVTEFNSTDSALDKAKKILDDFAGIVAPDLPPGTDQNVLNDVLAVAKAVEAFLSSISTTVAVVSKTLGPKAAQAHGPKAVQLSKGDVNALPKIALANAANHASLLKLAAPGVRR
jgi:hypothetical protein